MSETGQNPARPLGDAMARSIRQVLWHPEHCPSTSLHIRVGSGQATYHRFDTPSGQHLINLGRQMIAAKLRPEYCGSWLSAREIRRRGYFGGTLSAANLLAHTCCHEYAHLIQTTRGERRLAPYTTPPSTGFSTRCMAPARLTSCASTCSRRPPEAGIALPDVTVALVRETPATDFAPGDTVVFQAGPRQHTGHILRVNRRTCTVKGTGHSRGLRFRVSPSLLHHHDET